MSQLDVESLQLSLRKRLDDPRVHLSYLQHCESTNTECQRMGLHHSVVIAERQSAGRGRRGNLWHSSAAQNIYCSIGLRKTIAAPILGLVSLQVGVCVASVLRRLGYHGVELKWPNDILLEGRKLGGILIESRPLSDDDFFLVIGLGLNVSLDDRQLAAIAQPAISLRQHGQHEPDRQRILSELLADIMLRVMRLDAGATDGLLAQFNALDRYHGQAIRVSTLKSHIDGIHRGIDESGQILVQTAQGMQCFNAAEISLRQVQDAVDR